jgi:hypothetical protein
VVPLAVSELAAASRDYPVVFVGKAEGILTMTALVGLHDRVNVFIDDAGQWQAGRYVPACVRRYPFVLAPAEADAALTVCVDESAAPLNDSSGQPLFEAAGKETPVLRTAIAFLQLLHLKMLRTQGFAVRLAQLELLVSKTLRIEREGKHHGLDGLFVVDEEKLIKLPDAELVGLVREGFLPWIYAHLLSLGSLGRLAAWQPAKEHVLADSVA